MKEKTALTATIKIKKLNFLYEAMISSVLANVIVTLILAFFLFNGGERAKLFIWAGSIIIVALFRITTSFIYTGKKNPDRNFLFPSILYSNAVNGFNLGTLRISLLFRE